MSSKNGRFHQSPYGMNSFTENNHIFFYLIPHIIHKSFWHVFPIYLIQLRFFSLQPEKRSEKFRYISLSCVCVCERVYPPPPPPPFQSDTELAISVNDFQFKKKPCVEFDKSACHFHEIHWMKVKRAEKLFNTKKMNEKSKKIHNNNNYRRLFSNHNRMLSLIGWFFVFCSKK